MDLIIISLQKPYQHLALVPCSTVHVVTEIMYCNNIIMHGPSDSSFTLKYTVVELYFPKNYNSRPIFVLQKFSHSC